MRLAKTPKIGNGAIELESDGMVDIAPDAIGANGAILSPAAFCRFRESVTTVDMPNT